MRGSLDEPQLVWRPESPKQKREMRILPVRVFESSRKTDEIILRKAKAGISFLCRMVYSPYLYEIQTFYEMANVYIY